MIVTTTENIPGTRVVKTVGQVFGLTARSRSIGGNIAAGLKSLAGGEIGSYVKLNEDARRQALKRYGPERLRDGGQRCDHDALRLDRDGQEHERDRGPRHCPGCRVAGSATQSLSAQE